MEFFYVHKEYTSWIDSREIRGGNRVVMSKIMKVTANDDYTILIELEQGSKILFNMQKMVRTLPYHWLNDIGHFKEIRFEDKSIYWGETKEEKLTAFPVKLTIDNILFMIRD